jgi:phage anti-repressor protein
MDKPYDKFTKWFEQYKQYGFTENEDYRALCIKFHTAQGNEVEAQDYEITIDMAKELAMLQKTVKGKQARQYFIELEKSWNSPEAVMARALKMADVKLLSLQNTVTVLETENKLLAQQNVEWADRKILEALVKAYGSKIGFESAWREFKKELLYMHGININSRITNHMNNTGKKTKPKTLSMIQDEELAACISTAVAMCKNNSVNIEQIISKHQN